MKSLIKKYLPDNIKRVLVQIRNGNYAYFLWIFPLKKNKIVICNYYGKGFGDNGKYIVNKLLEHKVACDIVWLFDKRQRTNANLPDKIREINYRSLKGLYELATAKIWIDNCRKDFYPPKKKKQYYIQTWHGGVPLKKIEKDVSDKLSKGYVRNAKIDSKMADLFISNSKFCTELYRSSFWYTGEVLECGSPRCDILIRGEANMKNNVKDFYNIDKNIRILLYAPTFRNNTNSMNIFDINFEIIKKALEMKFGYEWKILVRFHPNDAYRNRSIGYDSSILDATLYHDMYELLTVVDLLITDYSSTMFEYSLTNKPVILYAPDLKDYKEERNFYFDIQSLPYPLATTVQQLVKVVEQFSVDAYRKRLKEFMDKLELFERGESSEQIIQRIKRIMN